MWALGQARRTSAVRSACDPAQSRATLDEYRKLGRTGVSVSPLCLGTIMFGPWGNCDTADSIRIIHRALDSGINCVDTADVYSDGEPGRIIGAALKGRRDAVVLATGDPRPSRPVRGRPGPLMTPNKSPVARDYTYE